MDLVLGPQPHRATRTRPWLVIAVLAVVAVVVTGAYLAGRAHTPPPTPAPSSAAGTGADITWSTAGPWPVPRSAVAGPADIGGGIATGYAHTALGAGVAAWNILEQMSSDAGPRVYTATVREQTFGDTATMLAEIERLPPGGSSPGTAFFYKIAYGDPTGDTPVLVSIAERTASSTQQGGYFAEYLSMRWIDGDWRMQVPIAQSLLVTDVTGYQPLGGPGV